MVDYVRNNACVIMVLGGMVGGTMFGKRERIIPDILGHARKDVMP